MKEPEMNVSPSGNPALSMARVEALIAAEISAPSRIRYLLLLLTSLSTSSLVASLLLTEAALPLRTRIALAVVLMFGLCWAVFAGWVLTRRRVLLARHRLFAARMAVAFTSIYTIGAFVVGYWTPAGHYWLAAAGSGAIMLAAALALLIRAQRRVRSLDRRRLELEQQLGTAPRPSR